MSSEVLQNLYDKEVICPVCGSKTKIPAVKNSAIRIDKKDSDFMIYYKGINPSFYEVVYCDECGYASLPHYFTSIKDRQRTLIMEKICYKWVKKNWPREHNIETGEQLLKLALLSTIVKEGTASEKGFICLKLSWIYRLKEDRQLERKYQAQAVGEFEKAYQKESFPVAGLDEWNMLYLIGELHRRLGDDDKSLRYFSEVLSSSEANYRLKDKVRDQKELIKINNKEIS